MPVTGLILVIVTVPGHRNVVRMHRRSGIVMGVLIVVLMNNCVPVGLVLAPDQFVEGERDRERWRHRREQIGDGDQPSPPSAPRLSQANHLLIRYTGAEPIAPVAATANRKQQTGPTMKHSEQHVARREDRGFNEPSSSSVLLAHLSKNCLAAAVMNDTRHRRLTDPPPARRQACRSAEKALSPQ